MRLFPSTEPFVARAAQVAALALVVLAAWATGGCASIPKGAAVVDTVTVDGADKVDDSDIEEKMATTASPKFLGLFRGIVFDYEIFDRFVLQRDLARVERYYRARGYYDAHVRAGRVEQDGNHVRVTVDVEEGPPVVVHDIHLAGTDGLPPEVTRAANDAAHSQMRPSKPFDEEEFSKTDEAIKQALTDRGFAYTQTSRRAEIDLPHHSVDVFYEVFPGPPSFYGPITIEGLGDLPEGPVRRALDLEPGKPYSTREINDAQQAVLDLGAFSSVFIKPELPDPPPPNAVVPLTVKIERSKLHQVMLGAGVEFDPIKTDLHLITGWESRNFLGGFRHFRARLTPGIVLYPTRFQTPLEPPHNYLPEERLRLDARQPGFIEARTGGLLSSEVNTYPLLLTPQQARAPGPVLGYFEYKGAVGVDRTWWKLYASPTYNLQTNTPFTYLGDKDPDLHTIVISSIDLLAHLDFRDDKVEPHKGLYIQNDLQLAGLGGDARDVRIQPDVRAYVPIVKKVTFAVRGSVGFLFPFNYDDPQSVAADHARWVHDTQVVFLRGFFSGGSSSNRGYPLRGVGPHGIIPFYSPGIAFSQLSNACDPLKPSLDPRCALPLGGFTLWEASAELRFPISGPLSSATFCDASDVSPRRMNIRLDHTHLSCGLGARYLTPVGPIRLDIGVRIPGVQYPLPSDPTQRAQAQAQEGDPGSPFGLPVALAFGIGEAF